MIPTLETLPQLAVRPSPDYRIAFMYKLQTQFLGFGGFLERGVAQICQTQHFIPGEETEGFDEYWYIDDGPTYYMEPKYHPATYFAIDMVVQPFWYLDPIQHYFERCQNFDRVCVSSTATQKWCQERGMEAKWIGFAADPDYHKPHPVEREYDWLAVWHNCEGRIKACEEAVKRFPGGRVLWSGDEGYADWISRGKCALNWLRGDIVNMRVFEVMAIGTPLITTRHEDMPKYGFVENEHYLGYWGIEEMLDKIEWVKAHERQAMEMAARAREFVLEKHTYYHRALEVFDGVR